MFKALLTCLAVWMLIIAPVRAGQDERYGWNSAALDAAIRYAQTLSTDVLVIATNGKIVRSLGNLDVPLQVHSVRKALLSALVGQHLGSGPRQINLEKSLEELGIDDAPVPLSPVQRQAKVLHLIKSTSGINRTAAAEGGLFDEKRRWLGDDDNVPGTVWAYNNWDYNALTTIFEARTGLSVARAFRHRYRTSAWDVGF